jgi:uncharacterized protein (AIM24 family)
VLRQAWKERAKVGMEHRKWPAEPTRSFTTPPSQYGPMPENLRPRSQWAGIMAGEKYRLAAHATPTDPRHVENRVLRHGVIPRCTQGQRFPPARWGYLTRPTVELLLSDATATIDPYTITSGQVRTCPHSTAMTFPRRAAVDTQPLALSPPPPGASPVPFFSTHRVLDLLARGEPRALPSGTILVNRIVCQWCQSQNLPDATSCVSCGAPLDVRFAVSDAGWTSAPHIRSRTEIRFGNSVCQVDGQIVPVAEVNLATGDGVFFEHHTLLWKEPQTKLGTLALKGMAKRMIAGVAVVVATAEAPGRVAFSRDNSGELVVLPLRPGQELDVREHAFLLASRQVEYSYTRITGLTNILFGGQGMFMDRFVFKDGAGESDGLLVLHGYGNVFQKTLGDGECIVVEPGGFLYKDSSVQMQTEVQNFSTGFFSGVGMSLMKLTGPGRVGIQSMYFHQATE